MTIKNSLQYSLDNFKKNYPKQKLVIGSFLIIATIGALSFKALTISDHLISWAPAGTEFYLHLKKQNNVAFWEKIKEIKPMPNQEYTLDEITPEKCGELSLLSKDNKTALLLVSEQPPQSPEGLELSNLDKNVYLLHQPGFPIPKEKNDLNIAGRNNFNQESSSHLGYLYLSGQQGQNLLPTIIQPWQNQIEMAPQAWAIKMSNQSIVWENQSKKKYHQVIELNSQYLPPNTLFWTHGDNWQKSWQSSLIDLGKAQYPLSIASQSLNKEMENNNSPEESFQPLFHNSYNLYITQSEKNPSYTLKLAKNSHHNPIWLNLFEKFWLKRQQKKLPQYTLMYLPDGTRAVEMNVNEMLTWKEQNINNSSIRWLSNADNEFIFGYFETNEAVIFSNNYGNIIDFIYANQKNSWINLISQAENCGFKTDNLNAFYSFNENLPNLSNIFNKLGPFIVNNNGDFCNFE